MKTQVKQFDFDGQNIYVGLDVHLRQLTVTVVGEHLTHKTFSHQPDPDALVRYLKKNFPGARYYAAYEAGFSGFWLQEALEKQGVNCIVVNAADIPTMDKERKQKRDPVDSRKIARSLRNGDLKGIYIPSKICQHDRNLIRARETLVKDQTRCRNRIKSLLYFYGINYPAEFTHPGTHWSCRFFEWLKKIDFEGESGTFAFKTLVKQTEFLKGLLKETTRKISNLSKSKRFSNKIKPLMSVPGIGRLTAMIFLCELADIHRFNNLNKLCAYVGLIPNIHASGEREQIGDMTKRGNSLLKKYLIESSWVAVRKDPVLMLRFIELRARMKTNQAIIRIARRLLNRIRYILINEKEYQINIVDTKPIKYNKVDKCNRDPAASII